MADDPTNDDPKTEPSTDPDAGAKKALDAERKARRDAEKALSEVRAQLQELTDRDKSDGVLLAEKLTAAEKRAELAESKALRHEVAAAKGLTPAQAKRLVGTTQEELEADADDILETFPGAPKVTPPPSDRPKPLALRGGSDPSDEPEETDPRKLAGLIPRG